MEITMYFAYFVSGLAAKVQGLGIKILVLTAKTSLFQRLHADWGAGST